MYILPPKKWIASHVSPFLKENDFCSITGVSDHHTLAVSWGLGNRTTRIDVGKYHCLVSNDTTSLTSVTNLCRLCKERVWHYETWLNFTTWSQRSSPLTSVLLMKALSLFVCLSLASSPRGLFILYATTFHFLPTKVSCNTDCSLSDTESNSQFLWSLHGQAPAYIRATTSRSFWSSEQGLLRVSWPGLKPKMTVLA